VLPIPSRATDGDGETYAKPGTAVPGTARVDGSASPKREVRCPAGKSGVVPGPPQAELGIEHQSREHGDGEEPVDGGDRALVL